MQRIFIDYKQGHRLVEEADILLYHRPKSRLSFGYWISKYTQSEYSHVGLAHWPTDKNWANGNKNLTKNDSNGNKTLFVIEQREFYGGRIAPLRPQIEHEHEIIDVFRINNQLSIPSVKCESGKYHAVLNYKQFTPDIAKSITNKAKSLIVEHKKYGWFNVWQIIKIYVPFIRLKVDKTKDDDISRAYVCSTLTSVPYRLEYCDLCPFIADEFTTPSDVARSSILHYVFTLTI